VIIKKITVGFVVQEYDVEKNAWIHQEFIAGDDVTYETEDGDIIDDIIDDGDLAPYGAPEAPPLDMKQIEEIL